MASWNIHTGGDFGKTIADLRRRQNLTQAQFAERAGLSRDYLAHLEAGRTSTSLDHLLRALRRAGATVTVTWREEGDGEA